MTRRNNKRNDRRSRNHNNAKEQAAHGAASMIMGALLAKALGETFKDIDDSTIHSASPKADDEPFNGVRQVSGNQINCGVTIPQDGTAKELPIPKGLEVFISEDGKPMIRKKVKDTSEPKQEDGSPITYGQIAKSLYKGNQKVFYWGDGSDVDTFKCECAYDNLDNCLSKEQVKRLIAFNKLQNIAKYLNDGWNPNFYDDSRKYFIWQNGVTGEPVVGYNTNFNEGSVYFKTNELAEQAIDIMGEESLADLFNANW